MRAISILAIGILALIALAMVMLVWAVQPSTRATVNGPAKSTGTTSSAQAGAVAPVEHNEEAQDVARTAVKIMTSFDPATDANGTQTALRASEYMTPALVKQLTEQKDLLNSDSGIWMSVAKHNATARSSVKVEDGGADTSEGHTELILKATWVWKGTDGFEEPYGMTRVFTLQMAQDDGGWKISDYTFKDIPGGAE